MTFVTYVKELDGFRTKAYELNPVQARSLRVQRFASAHCHRKMPTALVFAAAASLATLDLVTVQPANEPADLVRFRG